MLASGCFDSGGPLPVEDFPEAWARAECERAFACCDAGELDAEFGGDERRGNYDICTSVVLNPWWRSNWERLLERGKARYDVDRALACIEALRSSPCADGYPIHECSTVMVPTVDLGGPCSSWEECISGFCDFDGNCIAPPGLGDPCVAHRCPFELQCVDEVCVVPITPMSEYWCNGA